MPKQPANGDDATTVAELRARMRDFVDRRDWRQFHDPKNLSMSIAIEAAELMEHFQWARSDQLAAAVDDPSRRAAITDEIADVCCYVLSLANVLDIDLSRAVLEKLARNEQRYPVEQSRGRSDRPEA